MILQAPVDDGNALEPVETVQKVGKARHWLRRARKLGCEEERLIYCYCFAIARNDEPNI